MQKLFVYLFPLYFPLAVYKNSRSKKWQLNCVAIQMSRYIHPN